MTLHALNVMGIEVADRRRWQSAMTSPIGDVGSERVKVAKDYLIMLNVFVYIVFCLLSHDILKYICFNLNMHCDNPNEYGN